MWLFLAFLLVPLIEIALFIQIGGAIGLGWTLLIVVATAILGTMLVRSQGLMALGQVRSSFNEMRDPTEALVHGAMILFSGALLLTPGFFTDAVGFALLVPKVRVMLHAWARKRVHIQSFSTGEHPHPRDPDTIDGEWQEVEQEPRQTQGASEWTKH